MKTDIKPLGELRAHMDGDALVITFRATVSAEAETGFYAAMAAGDAEVMLRWRPDGCRAELTAGQDRRVIAEFTNTPT